MPNPLGTSVQLDEDFVGGVARLSRRARSALLLCRTLQGYVIGLHLAAFAEAKQSRKRANQRHDLFIYAFFQPFVRSDFGAAGNLEADTFASKIGSGGTHKADRFFARPTFFVLVERLFFVVLGGSQVGSRMQGPRSGMEDCISIVALCSPQ